MAKLFGFESCLRQIAQTFMLSQSLKNEPTQLQRSQNNLKKCVKYAVLSLQLVIIHYSLPL